MSTIENQMQQDVAPTTEQPTKRIEDARTEQKDTDEEQSMIASALSGNRIKQLLSATGPTVRAVLLKTDGSVQQVMYESTPSRNHVTEILGAPPSIIGQYPDLDVIVVGARIPENDTTFALNTHKLRYPFNNDTFHGDIFMYRFDQDCVMQDFPISEYQSFASKLSEDEGKVFQKRTPIDNDSSDASSDDQQIEQMEVSSDFMRELIIKKVKADFPAKFGRDPTDEELESYVAGTMEAAGALFGIADVPNECSDIEEGDEDEDESDYVPSDVDDEHDDYAEPSAQQQAQDKLDIENALTESAREPTDEAVNEQDLVQSEAFALELQSAMDMVQQMGLVDRQKILEMARQQYARDVGEDPDDEILANAMQMFAVSVPEECSENVVEADEEDVKGEDDGAFEREFAEALEAVKLLGKTHQEALVGRIRDTFVEMNGEEPDADQMSALFGRIKEELAAEAKEEFLEDQMVNGVVEDEDDPDYLVGEEALVQIEDDKKMEVLDQLMKRDVVEDEEEEVKREVVERKVKILVTPVKRRPSGSKMSVYLGEQRDAKQVLSVAEGRFEQINKRTPTVEEKKRLAEFLETPMLFPTEVDPAAEFDLDDENDEDYVPEKDTFDYSGDVADDEEFHTKGDAAFEVDENENSSNMIDID